MVIFNRRGKRTKRLLLLDILEQVESWKCNREEGRRNKNFEFLYYTTPMNEGRKATMRANGGGYPNTFGCTSIMTTPCDFFEKT